MSYTIVYRPEKKKRRPKHICDKPPWQDWFKFRKGTIIQCECGRRWRKRSNDRYTGFRRYRWPLHRDQGN